MGCTDSKPRNINRPGELRPGQQPRYQKSSSGSTPIRKVPIKAGDLAWETRKSRRFPSPTKTGSGGGSKGTLQPLGFYEKYKPGKTLGAGAFSTVYEISHLVTHELFACKIVEKKGLDPVDEQLLRSEVKILRSIDSPYIVKCTDFLEDQKNIYLALEYMGGGELLDRIVKKKAYTEAEARLTVHTLLLAIKACHDRMIVHRDLKPENLLLSNTSDDADLKVADFGFATVAKDDHSLSEQCGSPNYAAPELLAGKLYGRPADMWSVGVITFILLGGYPPFYDSDQKQLFRKIKEGAYQFHSKYWKGVSNEAKDLIKCMLVVDPDKRLNVDDALIHPWLRRTDKDLAKHDLSDQLLELRKFNARSKFRAAVKAILTINKLKTLTMHSNSRTDVRPGEKVEIAASPTFML